MDILLYGQAWQAAHPATVATMTANPRKTLLAIVLLALWGGAMLSAFWWYEGRYLRSFSEQTALFQGEVLQLPSELAGPGPIRLVHFWDPACPCNVGNQQHLSELIEQYAPQGVEFYALQKAGSHGQLPENLGAMKIITALPGASFTRRCSAARTRSPTASTSILDCADEPGTALAAIREGVEAIAISVRDPGFERLVDIAGQSGVAILPIAWDTACDLAGSNDPQGDCENHLGKL